jgi:glycosyltransferase 2 family protein
MFSRRWLMTALAVGLSVALLLLAVSRLDWAEVQSALARSRLYPWVPIAVASYLAGHLLRGVRCRLLLGREALTRLTATNIVVVGYAVNNLLPARAGELARTAMITERTGRPVAEALTVTLVERLLDGLAIVGLLFFTTLLVPLPAGWMRTSAWAAMVLFAGGFLGVAALVVFPDVFRTLASRLGARLGSGNQRLVRLVTQVIAGVAALRDFRTAVHIAGLSAAIWLFEAGMFLALLPALQLPAAPSTALLAMAVTNLGLLLPSTPGFIGPFHFFCMQTIVALGGPPAPAFAYAVLVHATFFVPITIWGVAALLAYGVEFATLRSLTRAASRAVPAPGAGVAAPAGAVLLETLPATGLASWAGRSRLLAVVVRAFLLSTGDAWTALSAELREKVAADVVAFVQGQINVLPNRLRLLFYVGLRGFALLVRLRHPRGFARLPPERQVQVLESWAFGRWSVVRKLFRLLRSTAFLAFFDHPSLQSVRRPDLIALRPSSVLR